MLATSEDADAFRLKERGFNVRVEDVAGNDCQDRHLIRCNLAQETRVQNGILLRGGQWACQILFT